MNELPSPEEIKKGLRTGYCFDPRTPGLQEAARELLRPIIENMRGREIVYVTRFPLLARIDHLEIDDDGFQATGTPIHALDDRPRELKPLNFGAQWRALRLRGSAVRMNMIADYFIPASEVVAEVKVAVARKATREIPGILERATGGE